MDKNQMIDFIGIGAPKCGTTSIAQHLLEHPEISLFKFKESQYFSEYGPPDVSLPYKYEKDGINGYRKLFSMYGIDFSKKVGEFSPQYIYDTTAAKRIKKHFPNIKLIVSLRNPVNRIYSEFNMVKYLRIPTDSSYDMKKFRSDANYSFEQAIKEHPQLMRNSEYYEQLKVYFELFPKENIKVIIFEEFIKNSEQSVKDLYNFLSVDKSFMPPSINKAMHQTKKVKSKKVGLFLSAIPKISTFMRKHNLDFLINTLRKAGIEKGVSEIENKNRVSMEKIPMKEETKKELYKKFLPEIEKLENLLGKDLSIWKKQILSKK
jgi:hypothetical protein